MRIKVYSDISSNDEQVFCDFMGLKKKVFSADLVKNLLSENKDAELRLDINCNGGSTHEGFAIYDLLRTSGKKVYCNIDGGCHSMATVILLAAPRENRTANPNASSVIHDVRADIGVVTAADAQSAAEGLLAQRNKILDIYADRTGYDRSKLEAIMLEEKERTAAELLQLGFISKINSYTNKTTNKQNINMSKTLINKVANAIGQFLLGTVKNFDFTDADGEFLFATDKEDDSLAVGDSASPDGTFELPDGRTITIVEGVVTEILEPSGADAEALAAQLEEAKALLSEAKAEIERLTTEAKAATRSTAKIAPRIAAGGTAAKQNKNQTAEERKTPIRAGLNPKKGGA